MIYKLGQVMLYIEDFDQAKKFWVDKLQFTVVEDNIDEHGMRSIEITPNKEGTNIVLIDKQFVAEMEPEINLETPSLMFFAEDLDGLYADMSEKNITLGELVVMPSGEKVFNFADEEENYFAVMEK